MAASATTTLDATNHHTLTLDYNSPGAAKEAQLALSAIENGNPEFAQVDSLTIVGYGSLVNISQIDSALREWPSPVKHLSFQLNIPIAKSTLQTIESSHPGCRIAYTVPFQYWDRYDRDVPDIQGGEEPFHKQRMQSRRSVLHSKNLHSVRAYIHYGGVDNYEDLQLVYDILTTCPNLRELDLSLSRSGCVVANYAYAFDLAKDEKPFPPFEVLKLSGYGLDHDKGGERQKDNSGGLSQGDFLMAPWRWLPRKITDYFFYPLYEIGAINRTAYDFAIYRSRKERLQNDQSREPHNMNAWMTRMDFSKLRHLHLSWASVKMLKRLGPQLRNLSSLNIDSGSELASRTVPAFLQDLKQPLQSLELRNIDFSDYDDLLGSLAPWSADLRTLVLAEHEQNRHRYCMSDPREEYCLNMPESSRGVYYLPRPFLNASQLAQLSKQNPGITHLTIDVPRIVPTLNDSDTWTVDDAAIHAAALQPNLTSLKINVESPDQVLVRLGGMSEHYWSRYGDGLESHNRDPSFTRTSIPALFAQVNDRRQADELAPLQQLEIKVGQWDSRNSNWGMSGPPSLLIGRWVCRVEADGGSSVCAGGNLRLGPHYYEAEPEDPYSEDWSVPDAVFDDWHESDDNFVIM